MPGEDGSGEKVEHSALSYRQSYFQDMPLPAPRPLLLNRPTNFREKKVPNSNTRTRPIRLRPRRPLCSKCRSQCSNNVTSSVPHGSGGKIDKASFVRKHKAEIATPKYFGSKKSTTGDTNAGLRKTSPVIKISYASPQGKGHVVRIPAKTHSTAYKNRTSLSQNSDLGHTNRQKAQKCLKKAKSNVKTSVSKTNKGLNGFLPSSGPKSYHEQHRRIRIIKSKGTYHSASANEIGYSKHSESSQARNQNQTVSSGTSRKTAKSTENELHACSKTFLTEPHLKNVQVFVNNHFNAQQQEVSTQNASNSTGQRDTFTCSSDNVEVSSSLDIESDVLSVVNPTETLLSESKQCITPMKIQVHKKNITKSCLKDGREMCIGDIVWGKITGFPWWPGRIVEIVVSRRENGTLLSQLAQITWFASTTISHMPLTDLYPFLRFFAERYNRKKKGIYKDAVRQATEAATTLSPEVRALHTMFETSTLQP
ncbi:PWWP domain-containing protein 2A-like [Asterias rubens]|uniref:PWWP domain-containing protein 2A-like n=1 Tax=Asterias rubens TaxID=7604 RepID=UPI0014554506|nr:PWWP domain-containing protein 2A-like [Asterias rubens]